MNKIFIDTVNVDSVIAAYRKMGYQLYEEGDYNLNIFGIRSNDNESNTFNDLVGVLYKVDGEWQLHLYGATTDPGLYYRENPMNVDGTAILAPGQYAGAFKIGYHQGKYKALVQNKALLLYRDANRDGKLDYEGEPSWEMAGINLHRANAKIESKIVGKFSAGCVVVSDPADFDELLSLCDKSAEEYGDVFSFTLFTEDDFFN